MIIINEQDRIRIYEHIQKSIGYYAHEYDNEIKTFTSGGILDKEFATKILENLVYSCALTKSKLREKKEFEQELLSADEVFYGIPKSKEYNNYSDIRYTDTDTYTDMDMEEIYSNIRACLNVEEVYKKVLYTQNLRIRANTIINSISSIGNQKLNISEETKESLSKICGEMEELISKENTDVTAIQEEISEYNKYATKIWNCYLSKGKGEPRWLVHNLSKGDFKGNFDKNYISTSLVTNKTMGLYAQNRGNCFGFIIKPKNIISATGYDTFTNNSPVNEYMGAFTNEDMPPIKLPWEIEEECIKRTIEQNGEMLNYDKGTVYSEIVLDDFEIEAMYYRSNGEGELAPNYEIAKKMAEERGLELRELDITSARENLGLTQMTDGMQRKFFQNILRKKFMPEYLSQNIKKSREKTIIEKEDQLIKAHCKEFYQKYIDLRKGGQYTKNDILQVLFTSVPNNEMQEMSELYDEHMSSSVYNQEDQLITEDVMSQMQQDIQSSGKNLKLTFMQKITQRMASNQFLNKLPFVKKFKENQLKMLPQSKINLHYEKSIEYSMPRCNSFIAQLQQQTYTTEEIIKNDAKSKEKTTIERQAVQSPEMQDQNLII